MTAAASGGVLFWQEPLEENIEICVQYMERMGKMDMLLEMVGADPSPSPNPNPHPHPHPHPQMDMLLAMVGGRPQAPRAQPRSLSLLPCCSRPKSVGRRAHPPSQELGITGGEEDGVDNENAKPEDLYTKPEEVWMVQEALQVRMRALALIGGSVRCARAPFLLPSRRRLPTRAHALSMPHTVSKSSRAPRPGR